MLQRLGDVGVTRDSTGVVGEDHGPGASAGGKIGEQIDSAYRKALAVDPFHPAAHNNLASLLARAGKHEEAAAHYRQTLANDPQHPTARLNLGRVLGLLGRREEARAVLQQALDRAERAGDPKLAAAIRSALQGVAGKR